MCVRVLVLYKGSPQEMDWLMIAYSALGISSINPGVIAVLCIGRDLSIGALYYYYFYYCYYIGVPEIHTCILYVHHSRGEIGCPCSS